MAPPRIISARFPDRLVAAATLIGSVAFAELPAPEDISASDGTSVLAVDVAWSPVSGAVGYRVLRATGDEAFEEIATTPDPLHRDVAAAIGVSYRYRVVAFDDAATSPPSEIELGWRNAVAPAAFSASDGTVGGGVELAWSASEGAIAYRVYRVNGNGNAPPQEIGETETTTFLDDSVPNGQIRTYTARAVTPAGLSDFAVPDSGFAGLSAPQNLRASDGQFSRWVFLRWNNVPQNTGYRILRSAEGEDEVEIGTSDGPVYRDETASPGTIYTYRVAATFGDDVTETSDPDTGWRGLPRPTGLVASDGESTTQIDLSWPETPGATAYRLLRSTPGTPWETFVEVESTSFTDTLSPAGLQIHYRLVALVGEEASRPSSPETGWRNVEAPTGLAASDGTHLDRVEIVWVASPEPAVVGYDVYRRLPTDPEGLPIGHVDDRNTPIFDDVEIDPGVIGTYWVCAVVKPGCSAGSDSETGFRGTGSGFAPSTVGDDRTPPTTLGGVPTRPATAVEDRGDRLGGSVAAGTPSGHAKKPATTTTPSDPDAESAPREADADPVKRDAAGPDGHPDPCVELAWRLEILVALGGIDGAALGVADPDVGGNATGPDVVPVVLFEPGDLFDPCAIWRGDLDGDGRVDRLDLNAFLLAVERNDPILGDLDRDGVVGPLDAIRMIERLGSSPDTP